MRALLTALISIGVGTWTGCGEPPAPPPPDPPRVTITPASSRVADRVLPVSLSVSGCDAIAALTIYDREEIVQQVTWAGNPTQVEIEPRRLKYTNGIAANLSLTATVTCADGRTNTSHAEPVTFFPVEGVIRSTTGAPVLTDVFVAEGSAPNVSFIGCSGNGNGTTSLVRVSQTGEVVGWNSAMPFACSNALWMTDPNPASGKRWAVEPGVGAFAFDPNLNITAYYLGSVQQLGVGPDGDAVLFDDQDSEAPVKRIAHQGGATKWVFRELKGVLMGNPSVQSVGVYLPVFADPFGQYEASLLVRRVNYETGLFLGENELRKITYGVGDAPPIPPVHFNVDATQMYFPYQPQAGLSMVLACATNENGCSGPAMKWQSAALPGQIVATLPFANGSIVAAVAHQQTWFLDAATGQVLNREGKAVSPNGALVTMAVQPGRGRDFYLLNGSGQPGSLPLEIVAIDDPAQGVLWRYEVSGSSVMVGVDSAGQSWLRLGTDLVKPYPIAEYQLIR